MSGIGREEVNNLIRAEILELENRHKLEGCEPIKTLSSYINGVLQSILHDLKTARGSFEKRMDILDNEKTGQVTTMWTERNQTNAYVKKIMDRIFMWIVSAVVLLFGYFGQQYISLQRTDAKLDLTNKYQLAQTLFVKYSTTGDLTAKVEAEKIISELKIK